MKTSRFVPACFLAAFLAFGTSYAMAAKPVDIMFVDTGNTGRSLSCETEARIYANGHHLSMRFISRALDVNPYERQAEMNAQILWQQRGVDLSSHLAEQITPQDVKRSNLILTLTEKHKAALIALYPDAASKTYVLTEYATGAPVDIEDPWHKPIAAYEQMISAVETYVPQALDKANGNAEVLTAKKAP